MRVPVQQIVEELVQEKKKKKKKEKKKKSGEVPCPVEQTGAVPCPVRQSVHSSVSAQVQVPSRVEADTWPPWVIPQTPPLTIQDVLARYHQDPEYSVFGDHDYYPPSDHADS